MARQAPDAHPRGMARPRRPAASRGAPQSRGRSRRRRQRRTLRRGGADGAPRADGEAGRDGGRRPRGHRRALRRHDVAGALIRRATQSVGVRGRPTGDGTARDATAGSVGFTLTPPLTELRVGSYAWRKRANPSKPPNDGDHNQNQNQNQHAGEAAAIASFGEDAYRSLAPVRAPSGSRIAARRGATAARSSSSSLRRVSSRPRR